MEGSSPPSKRRINAVWLRESRRLFSLSRGENAEEEDWRQEEGGEPARAGEAAQSLEKHRGLSQAPMQRLHGKRPLKGRQVAGRGH